MVQRKSESASSLNHRANYGGFFTVDRRAWACVCGLGMNAMVAYLVIARGTGGDNRTSKWSINSIEQRTGISRGRAAQAISLLQHHKAIIRDPESKRDRPKYKIAPAHEIPGCEGFPTPPLDSWQQHVFDQLGDGWTLVPEDIKPNQHEERDRWKVWFPRKVADKIVELGWAIRCKCGGHYRALPYDAEAAAAPQWIWLPNSLVDGAHDETAPVDLVRETGSAPTLRLLVDIYRAQILDEDGGVQPRHIWQDYKRHKVGERGPNVVWGFVPGIESAWPSAPFVAPHLTGENDQTGQDKGWAGFWACWKRLCQLGLIEIVAHLMHAHTAEGEIIHPMALNNTGLEIEREVASAAQRAALTMVMPGQWDWARKQGVVALAPVKRHIEEVQMVGIARLRYRPMTSRTLAFASRQEEWRKEVSRLDELARSTVAEQLATSREIKVDQGASKIP
jgi:hypothetical protein